MALEQRRKWTFEEYQDRPDELAFAELIDGELFMFGERIDIDGDWSMTPAPRARHQILAGIIYHRIFSHLDAHPIGQVFYPPLDVWLNPAERKAFHPDVLFLSQERAGLLTSKGIQGAPDLVVEVLSPKTQKYDLTGKKAAYEAAGVPEYWAVWQDWPQIQVYRLDATGHYGKPSILEAGDSLTTDLLPGFALALDDLYRNLPADEG